MLDAVPEGLELGAVQYRIAGLESAAFVSFLYFDRGNGFPQFPSDIFAQWFKFVGKNHSVQAKRFLQRIRSLSPVCQIPLGDQKIPKLV